jgi:hypothetical protein
MDKLKKRTEDCVYSSYTYVEPYHSEDEKHYINTLEYFVI